MPTKLSVRLWLAAILSVQQSASEPPGTGTCTEDASCAQLAAEGKCETNSKYMLTTCRKSCGSCEFGTCQRPDGWKPALQQGQLYDMIRNVLKFPQVKPRLIKKNPPMVVMDEFMSEEDVEAFFAQVINVSVWQESKAGDAKSQSRTSSNIFCTTSACLNKPIVKKLLKRVYKLTGFPVEHIEQIQVVRYRKGEFYGPHSDNHINFYWMPSGPRVFTLFAYLSTVGNGGETNFPSLNLKIPSKAGSAAIWPDVTDNDFKQTHPMTGHEGLPPKAGADVKYALNFFTHLYNYTALWDSCGSITNAEELRKSILKKEREMAKKARSEI